MTSSIPPNPWFSTINFNESFFASNTSSITLQYANANYLKRVGIATSVASNTSFSGNVAVDGILTCNNNVIVNNKSLDIDGALGQIRYADNKVQNTAYTGGTAGTYTNTNMTIDANGKISAISNGTAPPANLLPLNNTWTGSQLWSNTVIGSLQSNAFQPPGTDNSNYVPTTAWVQTALVTGGAYTTVTFEVSADSSLVPYTMPVTATSYNLIIVSFGGNGGLNTSSSLTSFMGGAGGAGQYYRYNNVPIETSRNYSYRFTKGTGANSTNTIGVIWYKNFAGDNASKLIQLYNGGNGTDAVGTTPGTGGISAGSVYKPTGTTLPSASVASTGIVGGNGTATPTATPTLPLGGTIPLAGYTTQGGVGVGQQTGGGGGILVSGPTKATIILQIFS